MKKVKYGSAKIHLSPTFSTITFSVWRPASCKSKSYQPFCLVEHMFYVQGVSKKRNHRYKFSIKNGLKIIFRIINKFYLDVLLLIMTPCGHAHGSIFRPKINIEVSRENNIQRIQELWNIFPKFKRNKILKYRITEKN